MRDLKVRQVGDVVPLNYGASGPYYVWRYQTDMAKLWDEFVTRSDNATFLCKRTYMDYHADRFSDFSLVVTKNESVISVIPGAADGDSWISHPGLSYGGFAGASVSVVAANSIVQQALECLSSSGFRRVLIKVIPDIYLLIRNHSFLYGLVKNGFELVRRDAASTIDLTNPLPMKKGRKAAVKKAKNNRIHIEQSVDFKAFMQLENENLRDRYGVTATHTAEEIQMLASRHPENIKLLLGHYRNEVVAGAILFITPICVHFQYFASNKVGRAVGATDLIVVHCIQLARDKGALRFDFGISTEQDGSVLNSGLARYKESFGAVTSVADFYERRFEK